MAERMLIESKRTDAASAHSPNPAKMITAHAHARARLFVVGIFHSAGNNKKPTSIALKTAMNGITEETLKSLGSSKTKPRLIIDNIMKKFLSGRAAAPASINAITA